MRKTLLNTIFVVEGKSDSERLHKLGVPYIVRTEGTKVPRETINHLCALAKKHQIVILTDPDGPGEYISEIIVKKIPQSIVLKIDKKLAIKSNNVGIENVGLPALKTIIDPYINNIFMTTSLLKFSDLLSLNLTGPQSKENKAKLANKFSLLTSSLKNMYTQMLLLDLNFNDLVEALNEEK
ncbi:MAG: toprim domain-containing protein [Bacilli bacterium]